MSCSYFLKIILYIFEKKNMNHSSQIIFVNSIFYKLSNHFMMCSSDHILFQIISPLYFALRTFVHRQDKWKIKTTNVPSLSIKFAYSLSLAIIIRNRDCHCLGSFCKNLMCKISCNPWALSHYLEELYHPLYKRMSKNTPISLLHLGALSTIWTGILVTM